MAFPPPGWFYPYTSHMCHMCDKCVTNVTDMWHAIHMRHIRMSRLWNTTGFKFTANKQFRMEKKLGTSVCPDISHYALKNQYVQHIFFGWFRFLEGFWIKFGSRKLFFLSSIQYLNILQLPKTFVDNTCVFSYKKIMKWLQKHFSWMWQKIRKHFAKKSFSVFKKAIFGIFEQNIHEKCFCNPFLIFFIKQNAHVVNKSFYKF